MTMRYRGSVVGPSNRGQQPQHRFGSVDGIRDYQWTYNLELSQTHKYLDIGDIYYTTAWSNGKCREIRGTRYKNVIWSITTVSRSFLPLCRHAPSAPEDSGPSAKVREYNGHKRTALLSPLIVSPDVFLSDRWSYTLQ